LHRPAQTARVGERAVKFGAGRLRLARDLDARKVFVRRDLQVRKALVVAQIAVVFRLDVLDQPGFHEERVDVAFRFDEVDVIRLAHEPLGPLILGRGR
jgi:hypothetical protein